MTVTFSPETLFHLDDPDTSRVAAINLDGTATEQVMHILVDLIDQRGPQAAFELEHAYQDLRGRMRWPLVAFYSIHRRASQLKKQVGVFTGTGVRVDGAERLDLTVNTVTAHTLITEYMQPKETNQ